jgi:hypothetical protein
MVVNRGSFQEDGEGLCLFVEYQQSEATVLTSDI